MAQQIILRKQYFERIDNIRLEAIKMSNFELLSNVKFSKKTEAVFLVSYERAVNELDTSCKRAVNDLNFGIFEQ